MATINRFNKFTPRDYSMEWYAPETFVPNLEGWDNLLGMHQAKYDAAIAATQKYPKHLENRMDLAGQYRSGTESAVNDITKSYVDNGITAGNRKMRDFAMQLNKDWQPGGLAYELEQEYTDYQTALGGIDKYYKDQKAENSANRLYSLDKLQKSAQGEFKKDKTTGMYQRANIVPSLHPYVDIAEESMKLVKEIKENGRTDIIAMSPAWFHKIETEEVTPDTIRQVTEALLQQPKYAEQRSIELWREKSKYTPEQLVQLEEGTKKSYVDNFTKQVATIQAATKDKKSAAQLQQTLKDEGYYDGKITGKFDKDSKEALDKYTADKKAEMDKTIASTTADGILNKQINDSYTKPLVAAFARKKEKEDLIFNKQWETNAKISAQRANTGALVSAIQSLKPVPQSEFLQTPGLARPMDTLDQLKTTYQKTYDDSKKAFNDISNLSGITGILGTTAPGQVHAATEARLKSATPEEFAANLKAVGVGGDPQALWDYYNSPGAESLKNSYVSMQQARNDIDNSSKAQTEVIGKFFDTPTGKKQLEYIQKNYNLAGSSKEQIAALVANDDARFTTAKGIEPLGMNNLGMGYNPFNNEARNFAKEVKEMVNTTMKDTPDIFPTSLRGHAFTAIKGSGEDLKNAIIEDFTSGYTLGYNTAGMEGAQFKTIEQTGKGKPVDVGDVDLKNADMRFNVDAKGVTYYMTGKQIGKDGKPVVMVAEAPKEHYGRLEQVALEMLRQAEVTGNKADADLAMQMYSVVTKGPQLDHAVQDQLVLNNKNTRKLYDVIDPNASTNKSVRTFGNNENLNGAPVGIEVEANGLIYQKFKVQNPKTGQTSYLQTYKTNAGYMPIPNKSGGLYYNNSSEADNPVLMGEMMRKVPVEVNNSKVYTPNLSEAETQALMLSVEQASENNDDQ